MSRLERWALATALLGSLGCRSLAGNEQITVPGPARPSAPVTWTCTSSPCPWGPSMNGHAIVWPDADARNGRLGYSVSAGVYLPAGDANGMTISVTKGTATVYVGPQNVPTHRVLATLPTIPAGPYRVTGAEPNEVVSVLGSDPFTYATTPAPPGPAPATQFAPGQIIPSVAARWSCATAACGGEAWPGAVIHWPASAAAQGNGRAGNSGRLVFDAASARPLYPYMGAWANGCRVTARSGRVEVVEWQRGSDTWRRTFLNPGETHVVQLRPPEDGALIEAPEGVTQFSVSLESCTPPASAPAASP